MIQIKAKGLAKISRRIEFSRREIKPSIIEVYCTNTQPRMSAIVQLKSTRGYWKTKDNWLTPRQAGENAKILNAQAKHGRRAAFISQSELKELRAGAQQAIREHLQMIPGAMDRQIQNDATQILQNNQRHFDEQRGPRGAFKSLKDKYKKFKKTLLGTDKNILERTGQLRDSLHVRVKKFNGKY